MPKLIHFSGRVAQQELIPGGRREGADAGDPQIRSMSADSGTGARVGIWECTPGSWQVVNKPETETFYVIEGKATLADDESGIVYPIGPGDFVTFPAGWSGRWTIVETVRKAFTVI